MWQLDEQCYLHEYETPLRSEQERRFAEGVRAVCYLAILYVRSPDALVKYSSIVRRGNADIGGNWRVGAHLKAPRKTLGGKCRTE
jgi:hypothetical protein